MKKPTKTIRINSYLVAEFSEADKNTEYYSFPVTLLIREFDNGEPTNTYRETTFCQNDFQKMISEYQKYMIS